MLVDIGKRQNNGGSEAQVKTYLYKITNTINGKVYIGQARKLERRWRKHCRLNKSAVSCAIRKYGKNKFTFEEVGFCLSQRAADIAERELIAYWRNKGKTYNRSNGGNGRGRGGWKLSQQSKRNIANAARKNWKDPSYIKLMGKRKGHIGPFSKEHRLAISNSLTGRKLSKNQRHVISEGISNSWKDAHIRNKRIQGLRKSLRNNHNVINAAIRGWHKRRIKHGSVR